MYKAIVKALRIGEIILSCASWMGYMLISSDVPPVITANNLYALMAAYLMILLFSIFDFAVCMKQNKRGGYVSFLIELIILALWVLSYRGTNFSISSDIKFSYSIILGGIISNAAGVILKLVIILRKVICQ